jgi:hypothetical protein
MTLFFELPRESVAASVQVDVDRLVIAGWAGRDVHAIEHHIRELEAIGVPRPSSVPLFYRVAANQMTQAGHVEVVGAETSGEVEPLLFFQGGELFVSVASDHTDRRLETHSVALSKQVCVKPAARAAWRVSHVADHWDSLLLRSWIEERGDWVLYQEGRLSALLAPADLLDRLVAVEPPPAEGFAMTCGTVPVIGGIRPSPRFRMELVDERDGQRIAHEYACTVLPVIA